MSVAVITGTSNLNPLDGHLKPPKERRANYGNEISDYGRHRCNPVEKPRAERGASVRALAHREDERSRELQQRGAEVVYGNLLNFDAMRSALAEVDRTYFCYPISPGIVQAVGRRTTFARRPTVTGQIVGRYRDSHRRRRDCMAGADSGRIHS